MRAKTTGIHLKPRRDFRVSKRDEARGDGNGVGPDEEKAQNSNALVVPPSENRAHIVLTRCRFRMVLDGLRVVSVDDACLQLRVSALALHAEILWRIEHLLTGVGDLSPLRK